MRLYKPLFTILFLIILSQNVSAQTTGVEDKFIPATSYSTRDGLPSNNIQDIVQDEDGFLWLGTQEGLSRFDSSQFLNFSKDRSDSYSLPDILVEDLILMPDGKLWMSINEVGITVFDKYSYKSESIKNTQTSLYKLPNNYLYGISKDQNNDIWFSLYGEGIYKWSVAESKFYKHSQTDKNAWLDSKQTFEIMVDKKNRLWIGTIDSKVFYYDIDTGESKSFNFSTEENDPLSSPIYGFAESAKGEIYAGGFSGVFKYNEEEKKFDNIVSRPLILSIYNKPASVRRLMVDSNDNLWIGTTLSLLQYSNEKLHEIKLFEDGSVLENNWLTHAIIESSDGNIWIGTEGLGLLKVSSDWERFNVYLSNSKEPIDYRRGYQFKDNIMLAHTSSKIDLFEFEDNNLFLKKSFRPKFGSTNVRIDSLYQDEAETLWVSSIDGINKVIVANGESTQVKNKKGRKLGTVRLFYRAKNKRFYFYLLTENQLGYFDEGEMVAHMIDNTIDNYFKGNTVNQMSQGIDENIWLATDFGIETFNWRTQKFGVVYQNPKSQITSNFYIEKDKKTVWMVADGGLYQLIWDGDKLVLLADKYSHILPKVIFDKIKLIKDDLMIVTTEDNGLVEINKKTLKYSVFTTGNGLPSNVIIDVLFPGDNPLVLTESGIAVYNKDYLDSHRAKPKVIIDTLKISTVKIPIKRSQPLLLEHDYGSLKFDVALLSYLNSATIEYEYMLSGYSNQWVSTGNDDKFSFLNLDAGKYSFKIRGRSNYGDWSEIEQFHFEVKTPPWESVWAYALYVLSILAIIFWLLYLYKRKILYEHEITKQQTQKHIANAASKAKSDFLARVSHEVRTPLNGVLGMGELMLDTNMDEEQRIYADSIMASGRHLLEIINDILDLSKIEAGKLELEYKSFDLLLLVDEIVAILTSQSKQKQLLFTCIFDDKINRNRIGDVIRIKQILFNLLSNAFKFTKDGEISLTVTTEENDSDAIIFKVDDTGLGIDNDLVDDLFQPFVQADSAITRKYGGTGLGLAIVKQLVEKMQGEISAHSRSTRGSMFKAKIKLQIDESTNINTTAIKDNHVCLLIKQPNLRNSLKAYLKILNINYSQSIQKDTTCVFVDALSEIDEAWLSQLSKFGKSKAMVNFIGFNTNNINKNLLREIMISRVMSPPVTFNAIKKAMVGNWRFDNYTEETSLNTLTIKTLKLLVVEDNSINQQVSIEMLEKMGHQVDIVDNAEEALTMLNRNRYDILFLDYHLPMMDGLSLIKIWDNKEDIPVIMITADLTDEVMQKCQKFSIDNIVAKPFSQLDLFNAIEKALNHIPDVNG